MTYISELPSGAPAQSTDTFMARRAGGNVALTVADILASNTFTTNTVAGTSYTLQSSDVGKLIIFTSATAVTVTAPSGLTVGFQCAWKQKGAGQLTFVNAVGVTLESLDNMTKSAGQFAVGSLLLEASNIFTLAGSLTT